MRKILLIFFFFFSIIFSVYANDEIEIIKREDWWANETYRYRDSPEWQRILKSIELESKEELTEKQKEQILIEKQRNKILEDNFFEDIKLVSILSEEKGHKLAWPIQKTQKIKAIIIHHTYSDYINSIIAIRSIYRYHSLSLRWWDIGYNYLIWKDWEIFEWRAWWDYVVWAHSKRNNRSTIGIAIIWNYSNKEINQKQYTSLKRLVIYLLNKYNIDINSKTYYHNTCLWTDCVEPLVSYEEDVITWHRDSGHTACPWDKLYAQIQEIKKEIKSDIDFKKEIIKEKSKKIKLNIDKEELFQKLSKIDEYKLFDLLIKIEEDLLKETNAFSYIKKEKLKNLILEFFNKKYEKETYLKQKSFDLNHNIKVKLSYPKKDSIILKSWEESYDIVRKWNKILVNNKESLFFRLKSKKDSYVEILSWSRRPAWDKNQRYYDNKFRWDIIVYVKNDKLVIVNKLSLENYLKWLWEVSESANIEKIKTIIIAARTYARWYMTKDRKFKGQWYDASDNPDEFQKYLGYEYERRSPTVAKVVKETRDLVIVYDDKIIKPWYFNQSNWKTRSFYDYCILNNERSFCLREKNKYPYLLSVKDLWSIWKYFNWHWVWISWLGANYLATKWWNAKMIIKYFLRWINVKKINTY